MHASVRTQAREPRRSAGTIGALALNTPASIHKPQAGMNRSTVEFKSTTSPERMPKVAHRDVVWLCGKAPEGEGASPTPRARKAMTKIFESKNAVMHMSHI